MNERLGDIHKLLVILIVIYGCWLITAVVSLVSQVVK